MRQGVVDHQWITRFGFTACAGKGQAAGTTVDLPSVVHYWYAVRDRSGHGRNLPP